MPVPIAITVLTPPLPVLDGQLPARVDGTATDSFVDDGTGTTVVVVVDAVEVDANGDARVAASVVGLLRGTGTAKQ